MRVAVVGMGVIGRRLAAAVSAQPDMTLAGVAVRSAGVGVLARPLLPYFASSSQAIEALRANGIEPAGDLAALIGAADLVIDAGPAATGAGRFERYRDAGVLSIFCGGERDRALGPLVHPALNYLRALGQPSIRLPSCNTTALGRLIAGLGPSDVAEIRAVLVRCATDADKAHKGVTNGTVFDVRPAHHGPDLESLVQGIRARVRGAHVPVICGHVALVEARLRTPVATAAAGRISRARRVVLLPQDQPQNTAQIKARAYRTTRRGDRYELAVQLAIDDPDTITAWISLDNEAITIPEAIDAMRALSGIEDAELARDLTDAALLRASAFPPEQMEVSVARRHHL